MTGHDRNFPVTSNLSITIFPFSGIHAGVQPCSEEASYEPIVTHDDNESTTDLLV
jgi:hypothetical protein